MWEQMTQASRKILSRCVGHAEKKATRVRIDRAAFICEIAPSWIKLRRRCRRSGVEFDKKAYPCQPSSPVCRSAIGSVPVSRFWRAPPIRGARPAPLLAALMLLRSVVLCACLLPRFELERWEAAATSAMARFREFAMRPTCVRRTSCQPAGRHTVASRRHGQPPLACDVAVRECVRAW